jgi:hypothetical protein
MGRMRLRGPRRRCSGLGQPDGTAFNEDVDTAWDEFIKDIEPLKLDVGRPTRGWMLSFAGRWFPCSVQRI